MHLVFSGGQRYETCTLISKVLGLGNFTSEQNQNILHKCEILRHHCFAHFPNFADMASGHHDTITESRPGNPESAFCKKIICHFSVIRMAPSRTSTRISDSLWTLPSRMAFAIRFTSSRCIRRLIGLAP